ncbi:DUF1203 domain-containing protein [Prosthecomicrobium hirschii]|uniref:DUF1203 domain-containing protein n=1 Tax=Prosthecodimorpha hirschii TaxID=665126 RepID=UPI000B2DA7C1|nr:DUF1203 domain-containing protein [Prosthecomicrobium hirschii]
MTAATSMSETRPLPFRIRGIDPAAVAAAFALDDDGLAAIGAVRVIAEAGGGYPCRITLEEAEAGEDLILMNYEHQPASSPYGSRGPIYVRRRGLDRAGPLVLDHVPAQIRTRLLSVRAYDAADMIVEAEVVEGTELEALATAWLARPAIAYLHVHFARRGCFAARVERA